LHNLEMDFRIVEETRKAIASDACIEHLVAHLEKFPKLREAIDTIAEDDVPLRKRLSRVSYAVKQASTNAPEKESSETRPILSLNHSSASFDIDSFNINANGYRPPEQKDVLLIVPCSGEKPYSASKTHLYLQGQLETAFSENVKHLSQLHKVTLSGLYGPVPQEHEQQPEVLSYDFRLDSINAAQIELVADRLVRYLERHQSSYRFCCAYATSRAYRAVLDLAANKLAQQQAGCPEGERLMLHVIPREPKARRLTDFYRRENVAELVGELRPVLQAKQKVRPKVNPDAAR
jgi:predicted RNA-binding protein